MTGMKELDQILEGVENPFGFDDGVNELGAAKKEEENQERENDNSGNDGTRKENIENNHDEEPDNIKYDGKGNVSGL